MARPIQLIGFDCGSTTTSIVVARGWLTQGATGRAEIADTEIVYSSPLELTPFAGDEIDIARLEAMLDVWLTAAGVVPESIFGGGALVTGLAARRANARQVAELVERRLADAVVATADDPRLESWLAFMGSARTISRQHRRTGVLNLDIGGGTTNLALGIDGQVMATGSLFVGARHFEFYPGTYRLAGLSNFAAELAESLGLDATPERTYAPADIERILDFYQELLEAAVAPQAAAPAKAIALRHVQVPFAWPPGAEAPTITLSGGVGQLVYGILREGRQPGITEYGDLGGELAERIAHSHTIAPRLEYFPSGLGRATAFGLLQHGTELSGATIFLPRTDCLPLKNVPIVGRIGPTISAADLQRIFELARCCAPAACIQVDLKVQDAAKVRELGTRLAAIIAERGYPPERTLVLAVPANLGKLLGNYITRWGSVEMDLVVVDEVPPHDAQFVRLGRACEGVLPLSFYGLGGAPTAMEDLDP